MTTRWPLPVADLSVETRNVMSRFLTGSLSSTALAAAPLLPRTKRPAPLTLAAASVDVSVYEPPTAAEPQPLDTTRVKESETMVEVATVAAAGDGAIPEAPAQTSVAVN